MTVKGIGVLSVLLFALSASLNAQARGFELEPDGVRIERSTTQDAQAHPMPLSALKRVSNNLRIERKTTVTGERRNYLYRVLESTTLDDAAGFYRALLGEQGSMLFECSERSCGSSNFWAHQIFGERNLAGRDQNQSYFVGELDDGAVQGILSVYAIENARGVPYLYVSFIPAPPRDIVADAKRGLLLSDSTFSKKHAAEIESYLSQNADSRLILMSYAKLPDVGFADALSQSEMEAQEAKMRLSSQVSISDDRIETRPMGLLGQRPLGFEGMRWSFLYLVD